MAGVFAILATVSTALGYLAYVEHNRAEAERSRAETEKSRAETERSRAETEQSQKYAALSEAAYLAGDKSSAFASLWKLFPRMYRGLNRPTTLMQ